MFKPIEPHKMGNNLRDIILGGQDGLVNVLGIVMGVSAVTNETRILIAAGLAAMFAESISMAAVAYTSSLAMRDHYESELAREKREIKEVPEMEREEIRQIYQKWGFSGEQLAQVVKTITANETTWLNVMMSEELHLEPIVTKTVLKTSVIVGLAALVGSLMPVIPFFFLPHKLAFVLSIVFSAIALFTVGVYEAKTLVGDWRKNGAQMVIIGLGAALIGFVVARIFGAA